MFSLLRAGLMAAVAAACFAVACLTATAANNPAVFSVAYIVRAVAPGKYVRPQASVEDMYRPDRFGRTNSENVEVTTGR
ncbi:MAG: hypothetical protein WBE48_03930 [Xanthobacteraceae bacterium]|jgi:uncharacterized protein YfaS (alpha-2-macroglobulin family)